MPDYWDDTQQEEMGDKWTLDDEMEGPSEELNIIAEEALRGNRGAQNYLRRLWDNESWPSIKKKLLTEGSVWYVWWMDGVRNHDSSFFERDK